MLIYASVIWLRAKSGFDFVDRLDSHHDIGVVRGEGKSEAAFFAKDLDVCLGRKSGSIEDVWMLWTRIKDLHPSAFAEVLVASVALRYTSWSSFA